MYLGKLLVVEYFPIANQLKEGFHLNEEVLDCFQIPLEDLKIQSRNCCNKNRIVLSKMDFL